MTVPQTGIEAFLLRWSRRKRAAERPAATSDHRSSLFDPASLPPIQYIQAASDIRAFLAPGVPLELTRTALRRAWATDPTIRDFIGVADNQWDFTNPDGVPGFGPLNFTSDLHRLLSELVGDDSVPQIEGQATGALQTPTLTGATERPSWRPSG
jgi:hypothetical protein